MLFCPLSWSFTLFSSVDSTLPSTKLRKHFFPKSGSESVSESETMMFSKLLPFLLAIPAATCQKCKIFPDNSIYNTPIDTLPVDQRSDDYVNSIGAAGKLHPDFGAGKWAGSIIGIPFNQVKKSQKKRAVRFLYKSESNNVKYPIPRKPKIEGGSDRHMIMLDRNKCKLYEIFNAQKIKSGKHKGKWKGGSGAVFDLTSNKLRPDTWTSADAAGLPIFPLLVRRDEVAKKKEIRHALRFTAARTRGDYIWPARHEASSITDPKVPPLGQRFRLKKSFNISGFSEDTKVVLRALKKYGMFLADNGSDWFVSGVPNKNWKNDELVPEFHSIKGSDFEAVDESSLMVNKDSAAAKQI